MSSSAPSQSKSSKLDEVLNEGVMQKASTRQARQVQDNPFPEIESNPIFQILLTGEATPEERRKAFADAMTATLNKEEDRARIRQLEEFQEWMTAQSTELQQQIIALTNTEIFAELQAMIEDLNSEFLNHKDRIDPMMEIVDSVYQLRTNGLVIDAFREIKEDREYEDKLKEDIAAKDEEFKSLNSGITTKEMKIRTLGQQRGLFGFGGVKESARVEIAHLEAEVEADKAKLDGLSKELSDLRSEDNKRQSALGELAKHKDRLRELLDLSGDEHRQRVQELVEGANGFIDTAKVRLGSLRGQFTTLSDQLDQAEDNNSAMSRVYAIMNEGLKDAEKANAEKRAAMQISPEQEAEEDTISKIAREDNQRLMDSYIKMLHGSQVDTLENYSDLQQQAIRVHTMKEATQSQIDTTRKLHSQGISATADRLAMVLTAVSGAALGETAAVAKDTLNAMREEANSLTHREVIRVAMGWGEKTSDLDRLMDELSEISEVQRKATEISSNSLSEINERMEQLSAQAAAVRDDYKKALAVNAEAYKEGTGDTGSSSGSKTSGVSPFKFG